MFIDLDIGQDRRAAIREGDCGRGATLHYAGRFLGKVGCVRARAAVDGVIAATNIDSIVTRTRLHGVVTRAVGNQVGAVAPDRL